MDPVTSHSLCAAVRAGVEKNFGKPLFQNTGMFVGMSLCLMVFEINARFFALKSGRGETAPLLGQSSVCRARLVRALCILARPIAYCLLLPCLRLGVCFDSVDPRLC